MLSLYDITVSFLNSDICELLLAWFPIVLFFVILTLRLSSSVIRMFNRFRFIITITIISFIIYILTVGVLINSVNYKSNNYCENVITLFGCIGTCGALIVALFKDEIFRWMRPIHFRIKRAVLPSQPNKQSDGGDAWYIPLRIKNLQKKRVAEGCYVSLRTLTDNGTEIFRGDMPLNWQHVGGPDGERKVVKRNIGRTKVFADFLVIRSQGSDQNGLVVVRKTNFEVRGREGFFSLRGHVTNLEKRQSERSFGICSQFPLSTIRIEPSDENGVQHHYKATVRVISDFDNSQKVCIEFWWDGKFSNDRAEMFEGKNPHLHIHVKQLP